MGLTRDGILASDDLPRQEVSVPEWGGHVWVRMMTGAEREAFMQHAESKGPHWIAAYFVAVTAVDETGAQLFDGEGDIDALLGKSATAVERIAKASIALSGLDEGAADDLGKN